MVRFSCFACFAREDPPQPWDPHDPTDVPIPDCAYLGGLIRAIEERWEGEPLTFYVTKDLQELPSYGNQVVSIILNDEWFRTATYGGEVLAVLRPLTSTPWFSWRSQLPPTLASITALGNYARIRYERALHERDNVRLLAARGWRHPTPENVIDVPQGYYKQPTQPVKPYEERSTDLFFAGSLVHDPGRGSYLRRVLKRVLGAPKRRYRLDMLHHLKAFARGNPEVTVKTRVSGDTRALGTGDVTSYAHDMMNARIALVPRGTSPESYRLFEAWRYGCIPVCEELPPRPFYQGAPLITLRAWRELGGTLDALFADEAKQRTLHEAGLRWWAEVCGERPTGAMVASKLRALTDRPSMSLTQP